MEHLHKKAYLEDGIDQNEESYFLKKNAELTVRLQQKLAAKEAREKLQTVTGITDEAVLTELYELGVDSDTLAAMALIPMLEVAWADENFDAKEKEAVTAALKEKGIEEGSPAHRFVHAFFEHKPTEEVATTWSHYARALYTTLDPVSAGQLKAEMIERAKQVAALTGGFLGLGDKVSDAEKRVIEQIEAAFS